MQPSECYTYKCRQLGYHVRYCPYATHDKDCGCIYCFWDRKEKSSV